jgi:hypothetical protein
VSGLASKPLGRFLIGLGLKTDGDDLWVVWPQNTSDGFHRFGLKTGGTVSDGLASKPAAMVSSGLTSKPAVTVFFSLASKLAVTVSPDLASKLVVVFLVEPQNQGGGGFPGLDLKTGSFGLVIWVSKSPQWFLGLDLKIKWASVYRLCHKTNGGKSTRDARRDLAGGSKSG